MVIRLIFMLLALWPALAGIAMGSEKTSLSSRHPAAEDTKLVVTGNISKPPPVVMDLATLMRFEASFVAMTNRRTGRTDRCKGVALIDILNFVGMAPTATHVEVIAANGYKATIRVDDLKRYEYLLSYEINGRLYRDLPPQENKGPLAIAINFDKHPDLDWDIYKHQLVWFVKALVVR